jgi:hypothetical protein
MSEEAAGLPCLATKSSCPNRLSAFFKRGSDRKLAHAAQACDKTGALRFVVALFLIGLGLCSLSYALQPSVPIGPALRVWLWRLFFEDRSGLASRRSLIPRLYELMHPARRKPCRFRDLTFTHVRPRGLIDQGVAVNPRALELLDSPSQFLAEVHNA